MTLLQAIVLGIIQGISEFLPISSDGHLVLFQKLLGFNSGSLVFNVTLHAGTLLAIICFYFKDLLKMLDWRFVKLGVISSVPTALIGLLMKKFFDFENVDLKVVAFFFVLSGLFLFFADRKKLRAGAQRDVSLQSVLDEVTPLKAFWIGIAQGLAVLPGLSRSGSTIATGVLLSCTAPIAAFYSFAISIPAVFGACLLELPQAEIASADIPFYFLGAGVSFIVGLGALWALQQFIKRQSRWIYFSYYLWVIAAVLVVVSVTGSSL